MTRCPSKCIIPTPYRTSFGWNILLRRTNRNTQTPPMLIVIKAKIPPPMAFEPLQMPSPIMQRSKLPTAV